MTIRIFLAHAKSDDDARLADLTREAHSAIARFSAGKPYALVLGRTFFETDFKRCASWAAWTEEVATGIDPITREPIFHAILVPAGPVGAGTAAIITSALRVHKPVLAFYGDKIAKIVDVQCTSQRDWQTGYRLTVERDFA